jgi:hypothetical protein
MRKFIMSLVAMLLMVGLLQAVVVEVDSYDKEKKELKYKDGDATKTVKVDEKAKFTTTDNKGENSKEATYDAFVAYVSSKGGKDKKTARKVDVTIEKDVVTAATWKTGKGGK